jgi:hypothetical protein
MNKTITKNQGERIWTRLLLKTRENAYEQDYYWKPGRMLMNKTITKNQGECIWTRLLLKTRENVLPGFK